MKKLHKFVVIILIVSISGFGLYIYNYNQEFERDQLQHQKDLDDIKEKQKNIDKAFIEEQQQKDTTLIQAQTNLKLKDADRDGLTYEEEIRLGTSDNERDTDGDGIDDNVDRHPAGGGETYIKTIHWTHNGYSYTTQFGIHEDKYWFYKDFPRVDYNYQDGRFATPYDQTIQTIAKDITDVSLSTQDTCKTCIAIDFVQSMVYEYDIDYISKPDYPKFAIETIIDEKGDCEDTSFLMASILKALNYDVVLLLYSDHMAVGMRCDGCSGSYYNYNGKKYYFLETTGYADNWEIGRIWGKYGAESAIIIAI